MFEHTMKMRTCCVYAYVYLPRLLRKEIPHHTISICNMIVHYHEALQAQMLPHSEARAEPSSVLAPPPKTQFLKGGAFSGLGRLGLERFRALG